MIRPSLVLLLGSIACVAGSRRAPAVTAAADPLAITLSNTALSEVVVRGRDGTLRVRPAMGARLEASVKLGAGCTGAHRLTTTPAAATALEVTPSTKGKCREEWTLSVPAGVAVRASFDDADLDIADLQTRLSFSLGHGTARLTGVDGDVQGKVTTGDIDASGAASWSRVRLAAQVGRVRLSVDGADVPHTRPAGSGDWIEIPGTGARKVHLETTVGDVTLRLAKEPPR